MTRCWPGSGRRHGRWPAGRTAMAEPRDDDDPGAEIVPLHPGDMDEAPAPVPAGAGQGPPPVIYADITSPGERRPIVPLPLRRENLRPTIASFAGLQWYRGRYHGLRLVLHVLAVLFWAVVGAGRLAVRQVHWWWLLEQHDLRADAVIAGDSREWRALHREAKQTRAVRGYVLLAELAALAAAGGLLAAYGPWWSWDTAAAAAVVLLARAGSPDGHRIISPAVIP